MKKYLLDYLKYIEKVLSENYSEEQLKEITKNHLNQIQFMQHERLIHLLVTCLFSIVLFICLIGFLCFKNLVFIPLIALIIVLLIPYIMHYYFLENNVQKMYGIYKQLLEKSAELKDKGCAECHMK